MRIDTPIRSKRSFSLTISRAMWVMIMAFVTSQFGGQFARGQEPDPDDRMQWWREARFGMFIHWGLYAIPAGEWNGEPVPGAGEWIMYHAKISPEDYKPLIHEFNPVHFDADEWARIAAEAGMQYLVITTKHHDGFCLFDSEHTDFDVMSAPFKRDIMKELSEACRKKGIHIGWYHSILDWTHPDASGERFPAYLQTMRKQVDEILTNYGPIDIMWFDGEWIGEWTEEYGRELYHHIREISPHTIINNRIGKGRGGMGGLHDPETSVGDFGTPEQEIPGNGLPGYDWETCMTMNNSWGFKKNDHDWKSTETLIHNLIDIASKGGNFLLNVGPTADGRIPEASVERLHEMGNWLRANGEAIYGTTAGPFVRSPEWGRVTARGSRLYLHVFDWPEENEPLRLAGLKNRPLQATLLAGMTDQTFQVTQDRDGVLVHLRGAPPDEYASVVVLDVAGRPRVEVPPIRADESGTVTLRARDAFIHGGSARYEHGDGKDNIGYWTNVNDTVSWTFEIKQAGTYEVHLEYASVDECAGAEYTINLNGHAIQGVTGSTGSWTEFVDETIGTIELQRTSSHYKLMVAPTRRPGFAVMNLRAVRLVPMP